MNPVSQSAIPIRPAGFRPRLDAIDLLRGAVMIIMALDHTRDFFSHEALLFDPTDLTKTNVALFLTRWVTHFCAPIFCFLAGTGACLSLGRGRSKRELSWFLLTRGAWLVLLELTLINSSWTFQFDLHFFFLQVIWAIGWSLILLAALIHLPLWAVGLFGLVLIAGHNLLDSIAPAAFGAWRWLWVVLHAQGVLQPAPGMVVFVAYPLVPWVGVVAAGYAFGAILKKEQAERRRILLWLGLALTFAFVLLRAINRYGDPGPWSVQPRPLFTFLSFLDTAKYPPSLLYLLMTLGPAILFLSFFDRALGKWAQPIVVFGRVPLFYYLLHVPLIHGLAAFAAYLRYGQVGDAWRGAPGFPGLNFPPDYGFGLGAVYGFWILAVLILYPFCRWFAGLKQRRRDAWLSYF